MEQKIHKKFFVFQISVFELGVANSHNLEHDTCRRQSMSSQTPLRFPLILEEKFSKSIFLKIMQNIIKALSWRFSNYLGCFHMFTVKACSETVLLREFSIKDFHSL